MFYKFSSATSNFQIVHARRGRVTAGAGPGRTTEMLKVLQFFFLISFSREKVCNLLKCVLFSPNLTRLGPRMVPDFSALVGQK